MDKKQTVFLTGCTRGIGLEIAKACLEKGWYVVGTARQSSFPEILADHGCFTGIHTDLEQIQNLKQEMQPLLKQHSPQVLINNAGVFDDADFLSEDEAWLSVWDRTMKVNLTAPALLSKWFLGQCHDEGINGIIINIASRASYRGDTQEYAAYAASKAGLVGLTKSIARDFSRDGVVAYSVAPGFIETDMAKSAVKLLGKDHVTAGSAFDEITQPEEVARLVVFLATGDVPHASGQTFHINAGSYMI